MNDERYIEVKSEESGGTEAVVDRQSTQSQTDTSVPDYAYGRNQEPLDGPIAVRGLTAGGGSYYATATSVAATGDLTITGCPFAPTYARVTATRGYTTPSISIGCATANPGSIIGIASGNSVSSNSYLVIVRDSGGTVVSRATFSSFTADGCTVNFSTQSGTTQLLVELFG